jgi:hypothetical protein
LVRNSSAAGTSIPTSAGTSNPTVSGVNGC